LINLVKEFQNVLVYCIEKKKNLQISTILAEIRQSVSN